MSKTEKAKCDIHLIIDRDLCLIVKGVARSTNTTATSFVVRALREFFMNHKDELKNILKDQNIDLVNALEKLTNGEYKAVLSNSAG